MRRGTLALAGRRHHRVRRLRQNVRAVTIYRVYFNERGPEPCSVDEGSPDTERTCQGVVTNKCFWQTKYEDNPHAVPCFWIEVIARRAELIADKIVFVP